MIGSRANFEDARNMATEWLATNLRFTFFYTSGDRPDLHPAWKAIAGDAETSAEIENKKSNEVVITGPLENHTLRIVSGPTKGDIILIPGSIQNPNLPPHIGEALPSIEQFSGWISRYLTSGELSETNRIAFGAHLTKVCDDLDNTRKEIKNYLPFLTLENASAGDLIYQINRPVQSRVIPKLLINRLTTWKQLQQFALTVRPGIDAVPSTETQSLFVFQAVLDINTDAERSESLPSDEIQGMFTELIERGTEILENGDSP